MAKASAVTCAVVATILNFKFRRVPEPVSGFALNAEIIKCPGLSVFGVIVILLLNVAV